MNRQTRDTAIRAIRACIDATRNDIGMNSDYYAKGSWRGDMHRLKAARELLDLRAALRELKPSAYPTWMREPEHALSAMTVDPR